MNWDAIGAVAEFAAATGVIVSIVYLASQIRQNTLSNRIAAKHFTTSQIVAVIDFNLEHPELFSVQQRGRSAPDTLDDLERYQFHHINGRYVYFYSAMWLQHELGALTDPEWWECQFLIRNSFLAHPGHRAWWRSFRDSVNPDFRAFIDDELLRAGYGHETQRFDPGTGGVTPAT